MASSAAAATLDAAPATATPTGGRTEGAGAARPADRTDLRTADGACPAAATAAAGVATIAGSARGTPTATSGVEPGTAPTAPTRGRKRMSERRCSERMFIQTLLAPLPGKIK